MSTPYVGEIKMFGGNFAPRGFAMCNGQLQEISSNSALFSLLGDTFGGDGRTTFALPDLRGRAPMHYGYGPGLSPRSWGEKAGSATHTLSINEMPMHDHVMNGSGAAADRDSPVGNLLGTLGNPVYATSGGGEVLNSAAVSTTGGGLSHNNMQPSLAINFIIALYGVYPSRS